jgi:hypothetical protein
MSWHEKLDRLAAEFLEETDAILGAVEDKAERLQYAREIMWIGRKMDCKLTDIHVKLLKDWSGEQ